MFSLSGMYPMTNSQNCTRQQNSVNCRDHMSVSGTQHDRHRECLQHSITHVTPQTAAGPAGQKVQDLSNLCARQLLSSVACCVLSSSQQYVEAQMKSRQQSRSGQGAPCVSASSWCAHPPLLGLFACAAAPVWSPPFPHLSPQLRAVERDWSDYLPANKLTASDVFFGI